MKLCASPRTLIARDVHRTYTVALAVITVVVVLVVFVFICFLQFFVALRAWISIFPTRKVYLGQEILVFAARYTARTYYIASASL